MLNERSLNDLVLPIRLLLALSVAAIAVEATASILFIKGDDGSDSIRASGSKLALVAGVGHYENLYDIPNAINDAEAMAHNFNRSGYEVVLLVDPDQSELSSAIDALVAKLNGLDWNTMSDGHGNTPSVVTNVVFYFAGHGSLNGTACYLIPRDAQENPSDPTAFLINLNEVIESIGKSDALKKLALIDAQFHSFSGSEIESEPILAVPLGANVVVGFAARPREDVAETVASGGEIGHGVFTKNLLDHIFKPDTDLLAGLRDISKAMPQQPPVYLISMSSEFGALASTADNGISASDGTSADKRGHVFTLTKLAALELLKRGLDLAREGLSQSAEARALYIQDEVMCRALKLESTDRILLLNGTQITGSPALVAALEDALTRTKSETSTQNELVVEREGVPLFIRILVESSHESNDASVGLEPKE